MHIHSRCEIPGKVSPTEAGHYVVVPVFEYSRRLFHLSDLQPVDKMERRTGDCDFLTTIYSNLGDSVSRW